MTPDLARILIVDDEEANMRALYETLRDHGYDAEGFTTGEEALAALRARQFDVLLTDLMMPGMDGVELLAAAIKIDAHIVGVLMTGQGTIETAVRAMQAGALDYVLKPLKMSALLPVLARAVAVRQLRLEILELRNTVAIHELNQAIAHTLDANVLLDKVAEAVLAQFEADEASIMLLAEDGKSLLVAAARGGRRDTLLGTRVPNGTGIAGHVVAHRKPMVLQGEATEAGITPPYPHPEIQTGLCMPMMTRNKLVGVLNVNYTQRPRTIPFGQIQVLSIFANTAAAGIEAARLYEDERRTHTRYSQILNMAADGIISIDQEQRIVLFNFGAEKMFGYGPEEVLGEPLAVLLPEGMAETHRGHVEGFGRGPDRSRAMAPRARLVGRRKDGALLNVEVSISKHSEKGEVLYTAIVRDVTERATLEDQLRQAQKMEAVGQLTGGIAHDFNNILTVVIGNAEAMGGAFPADTPHQEDLAELLGAAKRGATMVARLLQFSRRGTLSMRPVHAGAVVSDLSTMLRRLLPETIRFEFADATDPSDTVLADGGAIEQVLVNLCTNARDAMPNGGSLRIECERTWLDEGYHATHPWVTPGAYVSVAVTDTGMGMDEETRQRMFEPFFTTKPAGEGTGLGMAMVYGLLKQHNGMAHVYSELGQGTTVKLYFPAATEIESDTPALRLSDGTAAAEGTETILLAEDEPGIRRVTKRALEGKGYRVLVAGDGEEALELYGTHRDEVALVISDLVMPKLGGRQLAQALRKEGSQVPILFTSGYSAESASGAAKLPPGVEFLQKPWTVTDLLALVRKLLDEQS
jgi:PAS domain S-box-containing protein